MAQDDIWEIIPTSDKSILSLHAFPGALGTFYPWLEGVAQFSNILFDMNAEEFYSKWSQGNQGAYHVQTAQYLNCIFWSDNPYISDVARRTNYTLTHTSQLPLCYSNIPENTFKSFYLAFGVNSDPNWANQAYRESFAAATWATQVFSYYGARVVGFPGHDSPTLTIPLPKDCRGLMFDARNIECAGTFDAVNCTNFGAKSGSWREAFGSCPSLRRLYIKNLKANLNISWSPIDYDSINYIINSAANTSAITISVSPYTYNLLSQADFDLAASKNITIALITTNYVEDKRLGSIANKAEKTDLNNYYTKNEADQKLADLVNSAPETLDTLGELATALQENKDIVKTLNEAISNKANKEDIVNADWNQNDTESLDYIKNRTHYKEVILEETLPKQTFELNLVEGSDGRDNVMAVSWGEEMGNSVSFPSGKEYFVIINGVEYQCTSFYDAMIDGASIGNSNLNPYYEDNSNINDYPFLFRHTDEYEGNELWGEPSYPGSWELIFADTSLVNVEVEIKEANVTYIPLDEKYIPDTIARTSQIPSAIVVDSKLSTTSLNPVQNKVVTTSFNNLSTSINNLGNKVIEAATKQELADMAETLKQVQADWTQSNINAIDYVKNKSHDIRYNLIFEKSDIERAENLGDYTIILEGKTVPIIFTDYVYEVYYYTHSLNDISSQKLGPYYCTAYKDENGYDSIGYATTDEPFKIRARMYDSGKYLLEARDITKKAWGKYYFALQIKLVTSVTPLPDIYIQDTIARKEYVDSKIIDPKVIENKKDKDLIVTYAEGSTFGVTHSTEEIYEAIQNGTTVYFQKGTELLNLMEITQDYATFFMFYMNMEGKPQQKVVVITNNSIMLDQDDTYNYATTTQLNSYYNKTEVDNLLSSVGPSDDVLLKTAQTLTDEELAQVRSNLKFIGKSLGGQTVTVDGTNYTASDTAEIFGDYTNNIAVGDWSIAEGSGTVAKGRASHAEGAYSKALQDGCHVEGYQTEATGYWSHAEGEMTKVTSYASHAEGSYCTLPNGTKRYGTASGYASHIEGGGCLATGSCSHAEGLATTVNGAQSHAEGRYTIASGGAQHVEGIGNVEDTEDKYIHIAGNGAFDARSNAYTLDWDGNAWFSGDVYVSSTSGTNKDEGSKKLATEEYVDNKEYDFFILKSSTPGSNKKFKITITDDGILSSEEVVE